MAEVTKDTLIGEALMMDKGIAGCPSSAGESLAEASMVHGMNADKLISDINTYLKDK